MSTPSVGASYRPPVFVGRRRELDELLAGLEDALAGGGHVYLLSGEPGIGKSRLADQVAAEARARGAEVLWGRCWEAGGAPAYWPWVQSLRSYVRGADPAALRADLGSGASHVAQVLDEIRELFPDVRVPPAADPETARFHLFDAVSTFVRNASERRPLVIVLDDLHVADTPSLLLLRFVAAELGGASALVVGTYRDTELSRTHPLTGTIAELLRGPATRRIPLSGLSREDIGRFMELSTERAPDEPVVAAVHGLTEGNPLFVDEVVRLLVAEGLLDGPPDTSDWRLAVPERLREVIARRVGRHSEPCVRLLTLASVLGREFDLDALERLSGVSREELLDLLDEASETRVVTDVPGGIGRLRFSHTLVREALYGDIPVPRRIRLHHRAGEALESIYASDPEPHLSELAHHFFEAVPAGGVRRAVRYCRSAAERAVRLLAYEEAVRLYGMALQALERAEPVDQEIRCDLLLGLGDARARAGDFLRAKEAFLDAGNIARRERMPERMARAALGYGGRFIWEAGRDDPHLLSLLEESLAVSGGIQGDLRVKLIARLAAGPLRDQIDRTRADDLSREAVRTARRLGDPGVLAYALACRCVAAWSPDNLEERLGTADELVRLAQRAGDLEREHQGRIWRGFARWEVGDLSGAAEDLEAQVRVEAQLRQPAQVWLGVTARAALATFRGRLQEAERLIGEAAEEGRQAAGPMVEVYTVEQLWAVRREQGRLQEIVEDLRRVARAFPMYPVLRCELAHAYADLGREREAREEIESLAADRFAALPRSDTWLVGMCLLAEVAEQLGDAPWAAALHGLLGPYRGRVAAMPVEVCLGAVSRVLGLLAGVLGRWQEAERHFADALDMNERTGGLPWAVRTRLDHASMLLARDLAGDRDLAAALAADALEASRGTGLTALEARSSAVLADVGVVPPGVTVLPPSLVDGPPGRTRVANVFRREGEYWTIAFEGEAFRLKDLKGLRYLAQLLARPGREVHVLDLVAAVRGVGPAEGPDRSDAGMPGDGFRGGGELLDTRARKAYRERLAELEEEIEEARSFGDAERVARAEEERDLLARELARAMGLAGRARAETSPAERARVAVTRAIRAAIARIAEHSSALGRHLDRTVRTGAFCAYEPDPRAPVDWRF